MVTISSCEKGTNAFKIWAGEDVRRKEDIIYWAENEFDGIAEYGGVISVEVSTAPAA